MNTFDDDTTIQGLLVVEQVAVQNPSFDDSAMKAPGVGVPVTAPKLQHQNPISHRQATGTAVVTKTEDCHIVYGAAGTIVGVEAMVSTPPVGTASPSTDYKITLDVQVGLQGAGFATVLTSTFNITNAAAALQIISGTLIASPALVEGNIIRVIVTSVGSTGTQGQGLVVTVTTREAAQ